MGLVKYLSVLLLLLTLVGCEDKVVQTTQQSKMPSSTESVDNTNNNDDINNSNNESPQNQFSSTPELIAKYQDKQLAVIDSSEVILDGSSTLVITFSVPINPNLNFSNLLRLVDSKTGNVDGAWELSDNGLELRHRFLEPNRRLTLTIDKMLTAINKTSLKSVYQKEFITQDRKPVVGFASSGFLLPSKSMSGLPVITLNIDKVDVNFFKIKPEKLSDFIDDYGLLNQWAYWHSAKKDKYLDLIYTSRFTLNPKRNLQETVLLDLSKISQLQQEGVYIAVMNQAGDYNYSNPASLFSISNIGISVHAYRNGQLTVITHALDNGQPIANVNLSVMCAKSMHDSHKNCSTISAQTDAQGYVDMTLPEDMQYSLITANDGKQISFVSLDRNALNLSEFNLKGTNFFAKQLFVFGPRDLYRPNEIAYFNALLRDADGKLLPEQPIIVDVLSPDGQVAENFQLKTEENSHGLYQYSYRIPSDAATGKWSLRFNLGDDNYRYYNFLVEEFLPERMTMEIKAPSDKPILTNQSINFSVKGWYLYGAPATGNDIEGNVYLKKIDAIPEIADYKIGAVTDNNIDYHLNTIAQALDSNGVTQINIDSSDWKDFKSPIKVLLQASLLDSGGRPVTRYASQIIWPATQMPAIRALFSESAFYDWSSDSYVNQLSVEQGTNAEFEIAYINTDGQKLATNNLKARIIRERRNYYWSWSDAEGWKQEYNSSEFTVSEQKLTIDENSTAKVSYQPEDYGSYRIEVLDTKNNITSSVRFRCGYNWEDNTNGTNSVRPDQVKLSIDKTSYSAGDTAKVHVQAPVAGAGYISLETNDGLLWKQEITVDDNGLYVEIPIKDWGRHDIYINAMIIRPSTDVTIQTVKRAIGLLYLPIDTTNRQLNINIEVPKKTEPEKIIPVKVKMDKQAVNKDQRVTVLVSAVDSGVLNITNFVTPDPYSAFLGRKRYSVDQYDVYGKLIEASGRNISMSFGGDAMYGAAGPGGKKTVTEVNIIAQQLATIELNEEGEGIVDLTLPNFNGELRLMAQAWDDDRFGKAEQTMIVASPVIAELSTPRLLSGGDRAILALDINNLTEKSQTMQVNVRTSGLLRQDTLSSTTLTLDSKQKQIVQVPVIADYGYGQGEVSVKITGIVLDDNTNYQIKRSWQIGVRPAYAATTKNFAVAINDGESWSFPKEVIAEMIDNTVDGQLVVSNVPPLNIAQYIKLLFAYPYGCLEQTISGVTPSLYVNQQQLADLGIKSDPDEKRREKVQLGISRILSMQRSNGSFGLWSKESEEEYWLTVYATDFLLQAKERGYNVNDVALDAAMNRIGKYIYDSSAFNSLQSYYESEVQKKYIQFATKAYAMMVLVKQNKITPALRNELNHMTQQISNSDLQIYSPLPIAQLVLSAKLTGFENIYNELMPKVFSTNYNNQFYWLGDYGSEIRDKALILSLLIENGLSIDKQADYLFNLSNTLNDNRYFSTQELNALFIAGWSLEQHKTANKFTVTINGTQLDVNTSLAHVYNFDNLSKGLTVTNPKNAGPLYLKFSVSGYGKKAPAPTGQDTILTIERSYYDLKGNNILPESLQVGDLMVVVLDISAKQTIHDALIVDFLPAGLQLENQNLVNSSVNLQTIPELANLLKAENSNNVKYQQYRDDRFVSAVDIQNYFVDNQYHQRVVYLVRAVTVGNFMIPYPYVESMYRPERFAIGKSYNVMSITERNQAK